MKHFECRTSRFQKLVVLCSCDFFLFLWPLASHQIFGKSVTNCVLLVDYLVFFEEQLFVATISPALIKDRQLLPSFTADRICNWSARVGGRALKHASKWGHCFSKPVIGP